LTTRSRAGGYYFFRTGGGFPPVFLGRGTGDGGALALGVAVAVALAVGLGVEVEVDGTAVADGAAADAEVVSLGGVGGGVGLEARRFAGIDAAVRRAPTKSSAIDRALAADTSASRSARCATAMAFIL
jgi:hypothetical protein